MNEKFAGKVLHIKDEPMLEEVRDFLSEKGENVIKFLQDVLTDSDMFNFLYFNSQGGFWSLGNRIKSDVELTFEEFKNLFNE